MFGIDVIETTMTSNDNSNTTNLEFKLFGKVCVKNVEVTKMEKLKVVPVGKVIGLKMYTNCVLSV